MDGVFVGRRDEQTRFSALLADLEGGKRWRRKRGGSDIDGSRVVLVHGLGGCGKSRLLRRFEEMSRRLLPTAWLDWEDEQRNQPSGFGGAEGPSLVTVLNAVQRAVVGIFDADSKSGRRARAAFDEYRRGAARMPDYAARFAELLVQSRQGGSSFSPEDVGVLVRSAVSAGLTVSGNPAGLAGLTPDQLAASATAGGNLSSAALRALTGKRDGEIALDEYALVTDPERELTRRVANALRKVAEKQPLMVLLDTGEVLDDRAWRWLRWVMAGTDDRVTWVVGARFETEAEAGVDSPVAEFVHDIGDERLVLMTPSRFDYRMVNEYLESRTGRRYSDKDVGNIARFTRGLPLAVSLTADLLEVGLQVNDVCQEVTDGQPSSVISRLARRYLIHAEQDDRPLDDPRSHDVERILGLALAFGDIRRDPDLLAALWNVSEPLLAFRELARRHDFVLPVSRRLHDEVRETLRTDLLDPYRRARAREINRRALDLYNTRARQLRERWPNLDQQLDNDEFTSSLLAGLWHGLWLDSQTGLDLAVHILPVLAVASSQTADAAAAILDRFADTFTPSQQHYLDQVTTTAPRSSYLDRRRARQSGATPRSNQRRASLTDMGLALEFASSPAMDLAIGEPEDRQAAILVLQARQLRSDGVYETACSSLQAAALTTASNRLRRAIGSDAQQLASQLIWAGPKGVSVRSPAGLAAAELATQMLTDSESAWHAYATALRELHQHEKAVDAYDKTITINPRNGIAHSGRGNALRQLGRLDESLASYDEAVILSPTYSFGHAGRGVTLSALRRFDEALACFDEAITRDPTNSYAINSRGIVLQHMGRFNEALACVDEGITRDPTDGYAINSRGILLRQMGRFDEALACFDEGITRDPTNSDGHNSRGIVLQHMGRFDEALACFDEAITRDPTNSYAHNSRGITLYHMGQFDEALAAYSDAITLNPAFGAAYCNRGIVLVALGDLDEALAQLVIAELHDEGEGIAWAGAIRWHRGDVSGAEATFARVQGRVIGCTPFRVAEMEAIALCGLGLVDEAERRLRDALPAVLTADKTEAREVYRLIEEPALPGIERLRQIVDSL